MAAIQYNRATRFNNNEEESEEKCAGLDEEYEVEFEHTEKEKGEPAGQAPVPEWRRWLSS